MTISLNCCGRINEHGVWTIVEPFFEQLLKLFTHADAAAAEQLLASRMLPAQSLKVRGPFIPEKTCIVGFTRGMQ